MSRMFQAYGEWVVKNSLLLPFERELIEKSNNPTNNTG